MPKSNVHSRHVPYRCGTPRGPMINRPSVEYTGHGTDLVYDGFGGRIFRASEDWVRKGCDAFIRRYTCDGEDEGNFVNYSDLYKIWNIEESDFGYRFGYSPSEDYRVNIEFVFTWLGPGTDLYDKFGERVLVVEPKMGCYPYEEYMEL